MSVRENEYSRIIKKNSDEELFETLKNSGTYISEMLQAVVWELELRNLQHPKMLEVKKFLEENGVEEVAEEIKVIERPIEIIEEMEAPIPISPPLFSQTAILGFTLFFSPIFGGVLLAMNAHRIDKKGVLPIVLFSLLYTFLQGFAAYKIPPGNALLFLIPVGGALLLSEVLWNKYIGKKKNFEKRSVIVPLVIAILIAIPMIYFATKYPEMFHLPTS